MTKGVHFIDTTISDIAPMQDPSSLTLELGGVQMYALSCELEERVAIDFDGSVRIVDRITLLNEGEIEVEKFLFVGEGIEEITAKTLLGREMSCWPGKETFEISLPEKVGMETKKVIFVSYKLPEKVSLPSLSGGECSIDLKILLRPNAFIRRATIVVTDPLNRKVFEQVIERAVPRMRIPVHVSFTVPPLVVVSKYTGLIVLVVLVVGSGLAVYSIRVKRLTSAYRRVLSEDARRIKRILRNINEIEIALETFGEKRFKLKDLVNTVSRGIDEIGKNLNEIGKRIEEKIEQRETKIIREDFEKRLSDISSLINEIRDLRDKLSTSEIRIREFVEEVLLRIHLIKRRLKVLKAVTRG